MAKQSVNLGTAPNAGDGDPLRSAFDKINDNFDELYLADGDLSAVTDPVSARINLGLGDMAVQNANAVLVSGGSIDGAVIGAATPAAVTGTSVTATNVTATTSLAGTLSTAAQPNVTSLGTLSALTATAANIGGLTADLNASGNDITNAGNLMEQGKHTVWADSAGWIAPSAGGAEAGTFETTTNVVPISSYGFDDTVEEAVYLKFRAPKSLDVGTTIGLRVTSARKGGASGDVVWKAGIYGLDGGDSMDVAPAMTALSAVTLANDETQYETAETAFSVQGSPSGECVLLIKLTRDAANAADTFVGDAHFFGATLIPTFNQSTDA